MAYATAKSDEDATNDARLKVSLPSLDKRIGWFDDWELKTAQAQKDARRDRAYYDNIQWTRDELAELKKRGQPPLVKNRIARKVNFILGEEIAKRVDPAARPRTPQHEDGARAMTDALRYAEDEEDGQTVTSQVLKNVLVEGYGGAIKEMEEDEDGGYKHVLRHVEWDRLFYDPTSRAPDFSDAKYVGLVMWMDLDDAIEEFPGAEKALREAIHKAATGNTVTTDDTPRGWVDGKRDRVKIVEMYFRIGRDWYRSDFTECADLRPPEKTFLLDEKKRHSVCLLKMASCYVDADGMRYGVVRQLVSPQDEINKRSSKMLHALNTVQVISEEGMIADPVKFQSELAKPDGFATGITPDALQQQRVQIRSNGELAQGHAQLLQEAKNDIDSIGPSSATLPDLPAGASGIAFQRRQKAASQELGTIFDQLRAFRHAIYELDWLCIRQHWTEEKWLRVTDDLELNGYRFVGLNQQMTRAKRFQELLERKPPVEPQKALAIAAGEYAPMIEAQVQYQAQMMAQPQPGAPPEAQQQQQPDPIELILANPLMQQKITVNQVDQMLVDIVIDEAPDTAVLADEQFNTLGELMPALIQAKPDMAPSLVKALLRSSSLPDKRQLLQEFEKGPDPQQAQLQQQVQALQMALQKANVDVATTKAQLQQAQAQKTEVEAQAIPAKTQAEIEFAAARTLHSQGQAMHAAASAGEKAAGPMVGNNSGMMPNGPEMMPHQGEAQ